MSHDGPDRGGSTDGHSAEPRRSGGGSSSSSERGDPPAGSETDPADPAPRSVELTERELERWGRRLGAAAARNGVFVALHGPLGAGKTRLVQAACRGAGAFEEALSPTFTLVNRYDGEEGPVWHVDLYRVEDPAELADLAWDDLVAGEAPVFVEWAERAGRFLPGDRWDLWLAIGSGAGTRRIRAVARGSAPPVPPPGEAGDGRSGERVGAAEARAAEGRTPVGEGP